VRTLVVSDFHLGARLRRDVLRESEALEPLLRAVGEADRLVLLGDVVELLEGRPAHAMTVAEPVMRAIGTRLAAGAEVVLVPGNHDGALVGPWLRANGIAPAVDAPVPLHATPLLERLAGWLRPARVRVSYPGFWLADGVWATHGHYLDRHLLPEVAFGMARGLLGRLPRDGAHPIDYERAGGPSISRVEARLTRGLPRPLAALVDDLAELMRATTMPRRMSPITVRLLGAQMRRAAIPALGRVVHRLGVDAEHVVFGHVHRSGPLPGDAPADWAGPGGRPRMVNTGSWVYEPVLVHHASPPHPYWPGGAVLLEDGGEPRAIGLLDELVDFSQRRSTHG
jgi:hypothetical protein